MLKALPQRGSLRIGVTKRTPIPVNRLWVHFFPGFVGLRLWTGLIKSLIWFKIIFSLFERIIKLERMGIPDDKIIMEINYMVKKVRNCQHIFKLA